MVRHFIWAYVPAFKAFQKTTQHLANFIMEHGLDEFKRILRSQWIRLIRVFISDYQSKSVPSVFYNLMQYTNYAALESAEIHTYWKQLKSKNLPCLFIDPTHQRCTGA